MSRHDSKLRGREQVAHGTVAFHFDKPVGFSFKPGQAIDVVLLEPPGTDAQSTRHTFSIVSAPFENELVVATRMRDTAFKRALGALPVGADIAKLDAKTLATLAESAEASVAPAPVVPRLPRENIDHPVATGEDLLAIARRYAVDVEDLARLNGIGVHDALAPGSHVKVSALPRDVVPR